ncbi:MAG: terpene cyclase/mutase family protein, partial [Planctomycetaceae bacterium]|nr:terpene cyclase/mutase family protein [Planctomycetaceae bacterium]
LLNMTRAMFDKGIENARITKTAALLLMSGVSPSCIDKKIVQSVADSQLDDGGWLGIGETFWSIAFLRFYSELKHKIPPALEWLRQQTDRNGGFGRTKRDMRRIPVTGQLLFLLPELAEQNHLQWLEHTWLGERNSLTYKAAYTLMAFAINQYKPQDKELIQSTTEWLASQQQSDGGFAPWKDHPVKPDIFCTAIAALGLLAYGKQSYKKQILAAYHFMANTQLPNGIWAFHEIEDGASWGLYAMTKIEEYLATDK